MPSVRRELVLLVFLSCGGWLERGEVIGERNVWVFVAGGKRGDGSDRRRCVSDSVSVGTRIPFFRGKGRVRQAVWIFFPEIADGPFDSARRTDMAHGKARVVLQFNGLDHAQHLRDSLLTQSPVRCNSTAGFRRGRRRSPQGLRLLVSQMDDGAADSCCPSSLCSFSVMKLE
jgi:hypothetical protein